MERRRGSLMYISNNSGGNGGSADLSNPNPNYLTIVALEDGLTASLSTNDVEYSIDGNDNWTTLSAGTASPAINTGQYISFRGNLTPTYDKGVGTFKISKSCDLTGDCNSLLFGDDAADNLDLTDKNDAFRSLFAYCSTIKNVSSNFLSATTLASRCYNAMFYQCSSLITAPKLPATTLANRCYQEMFQGCSSLAAAPKLPATTLTEYCYFKMFYGTKVLPDCSNINFSSSTVVASEGLCGLFAGTKVTDSDLRNILPINSNGKYYLPVTKLVESCYSQMFYGCVLLTTAPELPATTLADSCYYHMFNSCALTIAPALPATTLAEHCYYGMFWNCTSLTTAPELPATTLANQCYNYMFSGCSKLNYIKAMFTTTPSSSYTSNWVYGVASSGTFVKNKNATWNVTGTHGIPSGWTVSTY